MSIRPVYAEAIFRGDKRFEFRRVVFGRDVATVVVYVTSPVCEVWGEFEVARVICDHPARLWDRTKNSAGIDRGPFFEYFAGKAAGYAIEISRPHKYARPKDIGREFGVTPPQSFVYLGP